ncbi:MAG: SLBB domain-containing protein, partial [Balneolaceae bacterium]
FLVFGNQDSNIRLRDQDIIKVDPYLNRVHVWGESKRVGYFETRDGETVGDLVTYMAGFTDQAYTRRLTLHRTTPSMLSIRDLFYPEEGDVELQNGDRLRIDKLLDRYENRVSIQGAVFRPGVYELEQGMTLYDLIQKSDGVREDAFMTRGVIHRLKENLDTETVAFNVEDVVNNPESFDIPLRKEDVVRISSIFDMREEYTVRVSGSVNRPSTINFRNNMTLEDAIFRADGFRDKAAAYRVEVARRVTGSEERMKVNEIAEIHRFDVDENLGFNANDAQFVLRPFDQVYVRAKPNYQIQQTVTITGEVQFPGEYVLSNRQARLSDLIEWAGGLSNYSYAEGASLQRVLEIVEAEREDIRQGGNDNRDQDENQMNRTRIDTLTTSVGIRLADALANPNSNFDLILEAGDELHIPKELQTVRIEGEVLSPTSVRYRDNRSFRDYIDAAGGVTDNAQRRRAYIVYANGEVDRTRKFLFFRNNPNVEPGATIIVPEAPQRRELTPQERVSLASSIASTALLFITLIDRIQR